MRQLGLAAAPTEQGVGSGRNRALIEVRGRRLLPDLPECVRLNPEAALVIFQFPLSDESSYRVEEIPVVNCVGLPAVPSEQIVPNVPPEGALVGGEGARRLRYQFQVDEHLVLEKFVLVVVRAILLTHRNLHFPSLFNSLI